MRPILNVENLKAGYTKATVVIRDISFTVDEGDSCGNRPLNGVFWRIFANGV